MSFLLSTLVSLIHSLSTCRKRKDDLDDSTLSAEMTQRLLITLLSNGTGKYCLLGLGRRKERESPESVVGAVL